MRKATVAILGAGVLAGLAAGAAAGPVKRVGCDPSAAYGRTSFYARPQDFDKPAEGAGHVNAKALLISLSRPQCAPLKIVVDSDKPDAKAPNLLRFDFSGKGDFHHAPAVPLKVQNR